jgi:hypothetical protein
MNCIFFLISYFPTERLTVVLFFFLNSFNLYDLFIQRPGQMGRRMESQSLTLKAVSASAKKVKNKTKRASAKSLEDLSFSVIKRKKKNKLFVAVDFTC